LIIAGVVTTEYEAIQIENMAKVFAVGIKSRKLGHLAYMENQENKIIKEVLHDE